MSILIKGMEMPSRCAECILCNLRHGTKCKVTGETYYNGKDYARGGYDGKPDWCPLVEVPAPHGRLIDVSALVNIKFTDTNHDYRLGWNDAIESIIDNSKVIIEAEGTE